MNEEQLQSLKQALVEDVVSVKFVKANGTVRDMNCTTSQKYIPQLPSSESRSRQQPTKTVVVWDIDAGDWRSFKCESVISWQQNSLQN